jgi:hypothetical protein
MTDYKQRFEDFLTACGLSPYLASNPEEYAQVEAAKIAELIEQKSAVEKAAEFGHYLASSASLLEDFVAGLDIAFTDADAEEATERLSAVRRDVYEFEKRYRRYLNIKATRTQR